MFTSLVAPWPVRLSRPSSSLLAWLTLRFIPNNCVGVVEKLWSRRAPCPRARFSPLTARPAFRRTCCAAASTSATGGGSTACTSARWSRCRRARSATSMPATASRCRRARRWAASCRATIPGRPRVPRGAGFEPAGSEPWQTGRSQRVGQRGRQLAILREGVYAINPALFVVITEEPSIRCGNCSRPASCTPCHSWQEELNEVDGFSPVVIGQPIEATDPLHPDETHPGR